MTSCLKSTLCLIGLTLATPLAATPLIENPAQAPILRTVQFQEAWRAGADEDAEYLFGTIADALADPQGNLYLLDSQQQQVYKFSPDGVYQGLVSRRGEGPGEIHLSYSLVWLDDQRLGMLQVFPPKLITIHPDGTPAGSFPLVFTTKNEDVRSTAVFTLASREGHQVAWGRFSTGTPSPHPHYSFVASLNPDGSERHMFWQQAGGHNFDKPVTIDERSDWEDQGIWDLGPNSEVFMSVSFEQPVIQVWDLDGHLLRRIHFNRQAHHRTKAQKEEAKDNYSFASDRELPPITVHTSDTDPAIRGIKVVGQELWVDFPELERNLPAGIAYRTTVCSLQGKSREIRSFQIPFDAENDRLIFLQDGRVVCLKNISSAEEAADAGLNTQVGEGNQEPEQDPQDVVLEVIVFQPLPAP